MASESGSDEIGGLTASPSGPRPARVFVALKIAPEIADELARMARELERFPVRLIAAGDIHLRLVPPWNEVSIPDAVGKLRRVADGFGDFNLEFRHVGYGPEPRRPRLLWADCAVGPDLAQLHARLVLTFGQTDERPFRPHVTLARLRGNGTAIARKCPIDRDLALTQTCRLGRTHAIASSRRKGLQGSGVAGVGCKSANVVGRARPLGAGHSRIEASIRWFAPL